MLTNISVGDPKAVRHWSTALAVDVARKSYFTKFTGEGDNNIIQLKVELEEDAGDEITYDLVMSLNGEVVEGDDLVEGTEEGLTFYNDSLKINQARKGASAGGRMTRKRTIHKLRQVAKDRESEFFAEWLDDLQMTYLSGDAAFEAVNEDRKISKTFAGNPITAPDNDHIVFGGAATSKATLTATDKMTLAGIERLSTKPKMMKATNPNAIRMSPVSVEGGKKHFVLLMSPWQAHDLRTETGDLSWSKVQQALATYEGKKNAICMGGLGMINDTVLHEHETVLRFNNYGAGANVNAARSLFLGRQAGMMAYGTAGKKNRYGWVEKKFDADNQVAIYGQTICGFKKTTYNNLDFGIIAFDTACKDPNAA
ncbi:N4-gp56 family major capsid protein [Celeribacter sp.]|uniref:N4-gp56 family major capsid protein n=1 Tax=Celeribacter sp. TaxID=1890673 RepID=UPI003A911711